MAQQVVEYPSFKLLIVGDRGTGKSTFVKRHLTGEIENIYEPTIGVQVLPLDFCTNYGKIRFDCWDTPPQQGFGFIREADCVNGHCAIIMFDVSTRLTYRNVRHWHHYIRRAVNLQFVESLALAPPEVQIDMATQQRIEARLVEAANQPLPDDDAQYNI